MATDRDMLANDLAETLSVSHGIDVDSDDVQRGLDAFLAAIVPTSPGVAAMRVGDFLAVHEETFGDAADDLRSTISFLKGVRLTAGDLRALVRAVNGRKPTELDWLPSGVTMTECPTCRGRATVFDSVVQRHFKPSGLPCTGAGKRYQVPEAAGE